MRPLHSIQFNYPSRTIEKAGTFCLTADSNVSGGGFRPYDLDGSL